MTGEKSWAEIKAEASEGWEEMKAMSFKALLTQCLAGFGLAMLAGFALAALVIR